MAGQPAQSIFQRSTRFLTQDRDQSVIDIGRRYAVAAVHEEEVDQLPGLFVYRWRLRWTFSFPSAYGFADERVHGFRETLARLVHGNIEVTNLRTGIARCGIPVFAGAAETQTTNLIRAQSAEQPNQREGTDHTQRVIVVRAFIRGRQGPLVEGSNLPTAVSPRYHRQ